ncbi:MAG: UDP-N-acetylenolpyruvoylglucosamine reductase, partial [Lachnospiraceae bacterium]|nr:UDP-N-acetylenolpyruvoylglucosamine reductase [Lachnospiraceae bacterium]
DHATAMDIWQLMCEIVRKVELNSGIRLEPEVIQLGNFT